MILKIAKHGEIACAHGGMEKKDRDIGVPCISVNKKESEDIQDGYYDERGDGQEDKSLTVSLTDARSEFSL